MTKGILQRLRGITISFEGNEQDRAKDASCRSYYKKASDPKVQHLGRAELNKWLV